MTGLGRWLPIDPMERMSLSKIESTPWPSQALISIDWSYILNLIMNAAIMECGFNKTGKRCAHTIDVDSMSLILLSANASNWVKTMWRAYSELLSWTVTASGYDAAGSSAAIAPAVSTKLEWRRKWRCKAANRPGWDWQGRRTNWGKQFAQLGFSKSGKNIFFAFNKVLG